MNRLYRIVRDVYSGYEVQWRPKWWPFWFQCGLNGCSANTNQSVEQARQYAKAHAAARRKPKLPHFVEMVDFTKI